MMLPSPQRKKISTLEMPVSQLNTQLMVSPVNASRQPSRTAAHHSGPERLARPYSAVDFHLLSFASLSWRSPSLAKPRRPRPHPPTSAWHLTSDIRSGSAQSAQQISNWVTTLNCQDPSHSRSAPLGDGRNEQGPPEGGPLEIRPSW